MAVLSGGFCDTRGARAPSSLSWPEQPALNKAFQWEVQLSKWLQGDLKQ